MTTVKRLNGSSSPPWRKRSFQYKIKRFIPAALFASLTGTYLDLIFVGKQVFFSPPAPFSSVMTINIAFTLAVLPIMAAVFLQLMEKRHLPGKMAIILLISLLMSVLERVSESLGLFVHSESWSHMYTFFGTFLYLIAVYQFHNKWMSQ
ncbi:CBO0543 family protein [Terrilactibacillus sp. S3-3]|nr:CBO0543 family protein [Terrilactibacillus sp. S3-3]